MQGGGVMMGKRSAYKSITISDVAKRAEVSASTVSRVLNNPDLVDEATKRDVQAAIEELGYVHVKQKSNKKSKSRGMVAFMVPDVENPHFQELIRMVEEKLSKMNYSMLLCIFNNDEVAIDKYLENLLTRNIDGCIMTCLRPAPDSAWISKFINQIPTVSIQSDVEGLDSIDTTEEQSTYEMIERLIQLGHTKIGFVGYSWNLSVFENRINAYKKIHENYHLPFREEYVGYTGIDLQSGYQEGCRILSLPDRPTAIHCFNTRVAMGVYIAIRDNKLRIPDDISLSAFDESSITQLFTPPLSVVSQPLDAMVSTAIDFLMKRIKEGRDAPLQHVVFPNTILQRYSIGPVKK